MLRSVSWLLQPCATSHKRDMRETPGEILAFWRAWDLSSGPRSSYGTCGPLRCLRPQGVNTYALVMCHFGEHLRVSGCRLRGRAGPCEYEHVLNVHNTWAENTDTVYIMSASINVTAADLADNTRREEIRQLAQQTEHAQAVADAVAPFLAHKSDSESQVELTLPAVYSPARQYACNLRQQGC